MAHIETRNKRATTLIRHNNDGVHHTSSTWATAVCEIMGLRQVNFLEWICLVDF